MSKKPREFVFVCEHMGGTTWTVEHQWAIEGEAEEVVRCRDCKHGHITIDGLYNKWCSLLATHDIDGDGFDPQNGYEPEPYFDSDFYCAWGERRDA